MNEFVRTYPAIVTACATILVLAANLAFTFFLRRNDKSVFEERRKSDRVYNLQNYRFQKFVLESVPEMFTNSESAINTAFGAVESLSKKSNMTALEKRKVLEKNQVLLDSIDREFRSKFPLKVRLCHSDLRKELEELWESFYDNLTSNMSDLSKKTIDSVSRRRYEAEVAKIRDEFLEKLIELVEVYQPISAE